MVVAAGTVLLEAGLLPLSQLCALNCHRNLGLDDLQGYCAAYCPGITGDLSDPSNCEVLHMGIEELINLPTLTQCTGKPEYTFCSDRAVRVPRAHCQTLHGTPFRLTNVSVIKQHCKITVQPMVLG